MCENRSSGDETAEPEPSDRDLTEDGTGRLGLAFNNPYLQRVYVDPRSSKPKAKGPSCSVGLPPFAFGGHLGRRECFGSEERRDRQTDRTSGYA